MFYVYIIESKKDGTHYVGVTEDLRQRLKEHNQATHTYTARKQPFIIYWYCVFNNKMKAYKFERYLKHGSGHAFARKHF
ncbi:MAG TPA: GIY-YIG nuclease family protein [Candidatus Paceibacterota bacterium]